MPKSKGAVSFLEISGCHELSVMNDAEFCAGVLADYLYSQLVATEDLGKHLHYIEKTLRDITEKVMVINLERMDDDLKEEVPDSWRVLDRPKRTIITLVGEVTYRRRVYLDTYGTRRYLLDEVLGITAYQRIEANAFSWILHRAAEVSFEKTREAFLDKSGVGIARTTVMRCVRKGDELLAARNGKMSSDLSISELGICNELDRFWGTAKCRPSDLCLEGASTKSSLKRRA